MLLNSRLKSLHRRKYETPLFLEMRFPDRNLFGVLLGISMVRGHQEKVSRISFSLQPELQKEFDEVSHLMGYDERSKALQIAIRDLIRDYKLKTDPENLVSGGILLLYNHKVQEIDSKITEIGHDYKSVIISSMHVHLDYERCINIIAVRGKYRKTAELEQELRKLHGMEGVKSTYFVVGK